MSIVVDNPTILKQVSEIAKKENTIVDKVVNELIIEGIEHRNKNGKSTPKLRFKDLAGKYSADEPFSAVKEIRKMRDG